MPRQPASSEDRSVRVLKVGERVRHILSELLTREAVHDDVLTAHTVSVTEVRLSPDLRQARVYVKPLLGSDEVAVVKALQQNTAYFQREVAKRLGLKFAPKLQFRADDTFEEADRIERLLHDPRVRRDLDEDDEEQETGADADLAAGTAMGNGSDGNGNAAMASGAGGPPKFYAGGGAGAVGDTESDAEIASGTDPDSSAEPGVRAGAAAGTGSGAGIDTGAGIDSTAQGVARGFDSDSDTHVAAGNGGTGTVADGATSAARTRDDAGTAASTEGGTRTGAQVHFASNNDG